MIRRLIMSLLLGLLCVAALIGVIALLGWGLTNAFVPTMIGVGLIFLAMFSWAAYNELKDRR